ncbi:MAG: Coenzyme F420 hydrogenase/dehydrogenase, beta subunit C-terminal domain [Verrucomicrobiales bacterium]
MQPDSDIESVIEGGYCIGCGMCAAFDESLTMKLDSFGRLQAYKSSSDSISNISNVVCPFSNQAITESALADEFLPDAHCHNEYIGRYLSTYVGWVEEEGFRNRGSSGGLTSWLLAELLRLKKIDHVIHVKGTDDATSDRLFEFGVSTSPEEVIAGAKSRYYPVELSSVIKRMLQTPGNYAIVGVPCFIKAIRLAARESEEIRQRLTFSIGIVCGHLKSTAFAKLLSWQCGVHPSKIDQVDFRHKLSDRPASRYGFKVTSSNTRESNSAPMTELFGGNWGHGLFKYKACDYCDDVFAETADIVFGDAWLPSYEKDSRGTNVVVCRNEEVRSILEQASTEKRIHLEPADLDEVIQSQAGGLRHRREGLAYRLHLADKAKVWRPTKRVAPALDHLSRKQRRIIRSRQKLAEISHHVFKEALEKDSLDHFLRFMRPIAHHHDRLYPPPLFIRFLKKGVTLVKTAFQSLSARSK